MSARAISRPALTIGSLNIMPPLVLAPMSALSNLPMRTLAEEQGCGLTITEFLPAAALAARNASVIRRLTPSRRGRPFGVQIYGRDPEQMRRAAALALGFSPSLIDINMGCPTRKVTRGACGAALMREPSLAAELVTAAREGVAHRIAVTVKIRSGWDARQRNAPAFAKRMVEAGAAAITVHGRTREQRFSGAVDLALIAAVKAAVPVPVIANGDIVDVASLEQMFRRTGCDAAMIGRAALGDPWLFGRLAAFCRGESPPAPPSADERLSTYLRHLELQLEITDPQHAVLELRKFARWYLAPIPAGERLRRAINAERELQGVRELIGAARLSLAARSSSSA